MSARRLGGSWLLGLGLWMMTLAAVRGNLAGLVLPCLVGSAGFLLLTSSAHDLRRFPGTDFELGLDRLFALLLPVRDPTTPATFRAAIAQRARLASFRQGVRRWAKQLQSIKADGYETASRIAALRSPTDEQDERALAAEALGMLRAERRKAGADPALTDDPIPLLAYGLGARPTGADLTCLEELLSDLGLSEEGDELRTHFDDVVAAHRVESALRNDAERTMFRDLAGASFVLGAATRILELVSFPPALATTIRLRSGA